jgi:purine-binding chemotaxis protein CheW
MNFLTFDVAGNEYGLPIDRIQEIVEFSEPTRVPGSSPFVRGVFNRAGTITPVVDVAVKFERAATIPGARTCIVIVSTAHESDSLAVGLLVDGVRDVVLAQPEEIEPVPAFGAGIRIDYLDGLLRCGTTFTALLNADRFLTTEELLEVSRHAAVSSRDDN